MATQTDTIPVDRLIAVDELKMYFGEPFKINDFITVYQPTIGQIVEFGEQKYFSIVYSLTCIPSDMKSQLEDNGINYMKISDFELFTLMAKSLTADDTRLLLGDLNLSDFILAKDPKTEKIVLANPKTEAIIDELTYLKMATYIRKMHNITPKIENAKNETTRKILVELDRQKRAQAAKEKYSSNLKPLISAMMRYPGFKYKKNELKECGLYEFMDTVMGAQIYVASTALLQGSYSGMLDVSKISKNEFNWLRSVDDK